MQLEELRLAISRYLSKIENRRVVVPSKENLMEAVGKVRSYLLSSGVCMRCQGDGWRPFAPPESLTSAGMVSCNALCLCS